MIRCGACNKFAVIHSIRIDYSNGEHIITNGSCKHCGYTNQENRVEYDDFEELGIEEGL
jgi:C4-type Zn-finger protein